MSSLETDRRRSDRERDRDREREKMDVDRDDRDRRENGANGDERKRASISQRSPKTESDWLIDCAAALDSPQPAHDDLDVAE
jgi:hypothetical protein